MSHAHDSKACSAGHFDLLCVFALGRNKSWCVCIYIYIYIYLYIYWVGSITHLFQVATRIVSCTVLFYLLGLRAAGVLG